MEKTETVLSPGAAVDLEDGGVFTVFVEFGRSNQPALEFETVMRLELDFLCFRPFDFGPKRFIGFKYFLCFFIAAESCREDMNIGRG